METFSSAVYISLHWRHNGHDGVSNHQPHGCLLNRLFRRRSNKTSKLCVTGLCVGNSPGPVNSPHKGPVTRKMFPFDDVITSWVHVKRKWASKLGHNSSLVRIIACRLFGASQYHIINWMFRNLIKRTIHILWRRFYCVCSAVCFIIGS